MSFELDLRRFVKRTDEKRPKFMRKILFQAFKEITQLTPVRTGRAKGNWFPSEGSPEVKVTDEKESSQKGAPADVSRVLNIHVTGRKDLYIANSLPYIDALENGHSQQAPNGMVKITKEKLRQAIESGAISPD